MIILYKQDYIYLKKRKKIYEKFGYEIIDE